MIVRLDRDSVSAGDDVEAHDREVVVDERKPLRLFLRDVTREKFLPLIQGGRATWIVRTARTGPALAVLAQRYDRWNGADLFTEPSIEMQAVGASVYFEYRTQEEPSEVLEQLRTTW
jgi:hypothetical protein